MAIDSKTLAAARKYTDQSVAGGGAIKGKNCVVDSIISITGGHRVTFKWTLDDGTVLTNYMDVMDGVDGADGADGADGRGIDSVNVDANNHLIVTYDDGTDYDAGEIQVTGQTIQRNVLPTASVSELGNIYQYIGATDANYTNGYFYQCVADGSGYKWENKKVQSGGGTGVDKFKDLDDVSFSNLSDGDIPVYDDVNDVWKNSGQIPLAISQLQGSMLGKADKTEIPTKTSQLTNDSDFVADANYVHTDNNYTNADKTALNTTIPLDITQLKASDLRFQLAIDQLNASVLNKVDKVPGKGLSEEDFTQALKDKLINLKPIFLIGSGLNLNPLNNELTATGMSIPIDTALDINSPNPVQNQAIAIPILALQGSMLNKADKTEIPTKTSQLTNDSDFVADANYVHTDNNYTNADKTALNTTIPLEISQLQGSMLGKADKSTTYTKTEVDIIIAAVKNGRFEVVASLPTTDIKTNVIYLVPKSTASTDNIYDEYINLDGTTSGWEKIGDTQIDLSNYVQKSSTIGLIKNDGSIDQTQYVSDANYVHTDNNYSNADRTALNTTIPLEISQLQGSMLNKADKTEIPTKTSQLTNDSDFVADANYVHTDNNYTNADKAALNTTIPLEISQLKASDLRFQLAISQLQGSMLNKADKVSGATANDIALLDASGNLIDSGKKIEDIGGNTILPTPGGSSATESGVVNVVQNATNSSEDVPSLYGIQKWSNKKTFRRVMDGSAAGTLISATGIGTWSDDPVPSEADWWQDAAFIIPDNSDDIDISFKFDPTGDAVALGGYILDTTTGKLCIKFANSVTVATCRVAVDITYTRTEVV